jgi:glycosyltransferase involved in cell wall biosynthesis
MRILHTVPAYHPEGPGGIEVYTRALVRAQRARGHEPIVLTGCAQVRERPTCERGDVDGVPVVRLHRDDLFSVHHAKAYHPGVEALVEDLLATERPQLLHVHHWLRLTCNLVEIAARAGIPAVVTLHDVYTSCPRCWRVRPELVSCDRELSVASCAACVPRWGCESEPEVAAGIRLFRAAYRHELTAARAVLAVSAATSELVKRAIGLSDLETLELPPGYERSSQTPLRAAPLPSPGEPFRFAHWGNLGRHKGTAMLLRATRALVERGPPRPFEVHVFGEPGSVDHDNELAALAAGLPVVRHGRFGFADLVNAAPHMGVLPSIAWETFSFALEECFELGLPCVVTDVGALPRRLGGAGLVVRPGDPEDLARALARVLDDPALRDRLAAARPAPAPTPDEHSAVLDRVYESALRREPPAASPAVTLREWAQFLTMQRDSAQARFCPRFDPGHAQ